MACGAQWKDPMGAACDECGGLRQSDTEATADSSRERNRLTAMRLWLAEVVAKSEIWIWFNWKSERFRSADWVGGIGRKREREREDIYVYTYSNHKFSLRYKLSSQVCLVSIQYKLKIMQIHLKNTKHRLLLWNGLSQGGAKCIRDCDICIKMGEGKSVLD